VNFVVVDFVYGEVTVDNGNAGSFHKVSVKRVYTKRERVTE